MREFLTERVKTHIGGGRIVWLIIAGVFSAASISVAADHFQAGESDGIISIGIAVGFAVPIVLTCWRMHLSRQAMQLAAALSGVPGKQIRGAELEKYVKMRKPAAVLQTLLAKGYLRDVVYDRHEDLIMMPLRREPAAREVQFVCSSCGGSGSLKRRAKRVCPYCGGILDKSEIV